MINLANLLDRVLLYRWLVWPAFFLTMFLVFFLALELGAFLEPLIEWIAEKIFIQGSYWLLSYMQAPDWVMAIVSGGIGTGLSITFGLVPSLFLLFFLFSVLESSGYMARIVLSVDGSMQRLGLPGASFLPLMSGWGCNVPAIASAATLGDPKARIMTILMLPFMTCGGRLTVILLFTKLFFPQQSFWYIIFLYGMGILAALSTALLLKKILEPQLEERAGPMAQALPAYRYPPWGFLLKNSFVKMIDFMRGTAKIIIPMGALLGILMMVNTEGVFIHQEERLNQSLLAHVGRHMMPVFAPIGLEKDDWPAVMGLLSGLLAKEIVVGTLGSVYAQSPTTLEQSFQGQPHKTMAYLLFMILYFPCVSVMAITTRVLGVGWTIFGLIWTNAWAYSLALLYYQSSLILLGQGDETRAVWWIAAVVIGWFFLLKGLKAFGGHFFPSAGLKRLSVKTLSG